MRLVICLIFFLLILSGQAFAFGGGGCGAGECRDCHSMDVKEAEGLLKGMVDKVNRVEFAEMPGVWLVEVEKDGQRGPVYVDFSKHYVVSGNIFRIPDPAAAKPKSVTHVDVNRIPLDDALLLGNPMAAHRVIVFTDPLCPYCAQLHHELEKIIASDPNIAFLIKFNPLEMHGREAFDIARAAVCTKSLQIMEESFKLIDIHSQLRQLRKQPGADPQQLAALKSIFDPKLRELTVNTCETPAVAATQALTKELGLIGTPTMVLPDGTVLAGALKAEDLLPLIRSHTAATAKNN